LSYFNADVGRPGLDGFQLTREVLTGQWEHCLLIGPAATQAFVRFCWAEGANIQVALFFERCRAKDWGGL
jgi:hypothetical protein